MGTRPRYSRTRVNVGEATWPSVTPRPRAAPWTKVVFPAPRSPVSATTSPGTRTDATASPKALMSSALGTMSSSTRSIACDGTRAGSIRPTRTGPFRSEQSELLLGRLGPLVQGPADLREVGTERLHLLRRHAAAVQDRRRVERGDHDSSVHREPLPADPADGDLAVQHEPRGEVPQRDDHGGIDEEELLLEPRLARLDLVRQRVPVPRRLAQDHIRDVHVLPADADLLEHLVQQLAGGAHERDALLVLVVAGALPDEHEVGARVAGAVHDLGPTGRQAALRAGGRGHRGLGQGAGGGRVGCGHAVPPDAPVAAGIPATGAAWRTAFLMARARTSTASSSSSNCEASVSPVAREKTVSPSCIVCAGRMAMSRASWAARARRWARSLDRRAFVATTASVVFANGRAGGASACPWPVGEPPGGRPVGASSESGSGSAPARMSPASSRISPRAFTAARAPTTSSPRRADAVPRPPFTARWGPWSLATVAPAPAPTFPWGTSVEAELHACAPSPGPGRAFGSPTPRSNRTAAGTMGTRATPASNPIPRSSRNRTTPSAAARPNALPPVSRTAWTSWTSMPGRRRSVSRVPGAPPRTSPDPTVPGGHSTTVHPVSPSRSVQLPTRIPGTSVTAPSGSAGPPVTRRDPPWRRNPTLRHSPRQVGLSAPDQETAIPPR